MGGVGLALQLMGHYLPSVLALGEALAQRPMGLESLVPSSLCFLEDLNLLPAAHTQLVGKHFGATCLEPLQRENSAANSHRVS